MSLPDLTLRLEKGSPLEPGEMDGNFTTIRDFVNTLETIVKTSIDGTTGLITTAALLQALKTAAAAGDGLIQVDGASPMKVNLDSTTLEFDSSTPKLIRIKDGGITAAKLATGILSSQAIVSDAKSAGAPADSYLSASTWVTRPITSVDRSQSWINLASNRMTFQTGVYRCRIWSMFGAANADHKVRFRNVTTSSNLFAGTVARTSNTNAPTESFACGSFTVSDATHLYELQHYGTATGYFGRGATGMSGDGELNRYAVMEIIKES